MTTQVCYRLKIEIWNGDPSSITYFTNVIKNIIPILSVKCLKAKIFPFAFFQKLFKHTCSMELKVVPGLIFESGLTCAPRDSLHLVLGLQKTLEKSGQNFSFPLRKSFVPSRALGNGNLRPKSGIFNLIQQRPESIIKSITIQNEWHQICQSREFLSRIYLNSDIYAIGIGNYFFNRN